MIKTDYLLIGQGIAGTLLSYELLCLGKSVLMIDHADSCRASRVAAAVLNPMAGKQWTLSADAGLFISTAINSYRNMGSLLGTDLLKAIDMYVFHEQEEQRLFFEKKQRQLPGYLSLVADPEHLDPYFSAPFGAGKISGLWLVNTLSLQEQWKYYMQQQQSLRQEIFDIKALQVLEDKVLYKDIEAGKIIFCEGAVAADNPLFSSLPFTRNRGEALLLDIPELPPEYIYDFTLRLVPRSDGLFWCGSNYQWNFNNLDPDADWRAGVVARLQSWLKIPFTVKDHLVAQRPTTAGQIPLIGIHPEYNVVAIFNGLGTRGFSSGPFWATELSQKLINGRYQIRNYNEGWFVKQFR